MDKTKQAPEFDSGACLIVQIKNFDNELLLIKTLPFVVLGVLAQVSLL